MKTTKRKTMADRMDTLIVATTDAMKQHKVQPEEAIVALTCLLRAVIHKARAPHAETVLTIMKVLAMPVPRATKKKVRK